MARDTQDLPIPPEAGPADPTMTVMSLVEEMREVRRADAEVYRRAEWQEMIVLGESLPTMAQDAGMATHVPLYAIPDQMHENVILPAVETMVARISQGRIDSRAWPRTPTPQRISAAEGANLFLDSERARERRDLKIHEDLMFAIVHGRAGVYTTWDKSIGPTEALQPQMGPDGLPVYDEAGLPVLELVESWGAIRTEVLSCFDYWTSGEDTSDAVRWQVRRRIVDKWSARAALRAVGIERDPAERSFDDAGFGRRGRVMRGVEVLEVWVKPGAMIKAGLFARVVDDVPVVAEPYPYKHGRLPIADLTLMRVRGSASGHTKVKDAIFQQRLVDEALRSILRRAEIARAAYLVGSTQIIDEISETTDGRIRYDGEKPVGAATAWVLGADVSPTLVEVYRAAKAAVNDVLGVSAESITGGDPSSTSSGEQLKTAAALDAQKDAPPRRRCEEQWQEVDRQKVELAKQFFTDARLVATIGDPVRAGYFRGADFEGVDVALEQSSGLVESHRGRARSAEEGAAAGYVPPQDAGEMRQTGLTETALASDMAQRVQRQGAEALRGRPQTPLPGVPPKPAASLLRLMAGRVERGQTGLLLRLIAEYDRLSTMQPSTAPQSAQPSGPPARPKLPASTQATIKNMEPIQ